MTIRIGHIYTPQKDWPLFTVQDGRDLSYQLAGYMLGFLAMRVAMNAYTNWRLARAIGVTRGAVKEYHGSGEKENGPAQGRKRQQAAKKANDLRPTSGGGSKGGRNPATKKTSKP